jgi:hypothetical protein
MEKEIIELLEFYFHGDCEFVAKEIIKKLQSKESDIIINATDSIAICGDGCCHTEGLHIWNGDDLLTVETDMKKETLVDILNHVGIKKIKQSKESDIPSDEEIKEVFESSNNINVGHPDNEHNFILGFKAAIKHFNQ